MTQDSLKNVSRRALLKGGSLMGAALLCQPLLASIVPHEAFGSALKEDFGQVHTQTRVMLGTFVTLSAVHKSKTLAEEALGQAFEAIQALETELTRHASSPLTELNRSGKLLAAPQHLMHVLQKAQRVHTLTEGAFDITVAPLLQAYKQGQNPQGNMRLDAQAVREAQELILAKEVHMSADHVRLGRQGMMLTLDGIAKGYIADQASQVLSKHGISNHLVNAGGDIQAQGQKSSTTPWRVAVENPARKGTALTTIALQGAMATSGNYEMFYDAQKKYHHLIDPRRSQSAQHMTSVTVTAPTALEADALATGLSAMPPKQALSLVNSLPGRECLLINMHGHVFTSHRWS